MANVHYFNVDIAEELGIDKAVMLQNIAFWIKTNEANQENYFEGRYWMYNSAKAFAELFPYWSPNKIQKLLKAMEDDELLISGNFNEDRSNRTKWYAVCNEIIQRIYGMHSAVSLEAFSESADSSYKDINPDINPDIIKVQFDTFWEAYDKKQSKEKAQTSFKNLNKGEREKVLLHVSYFVTAEPKVKYRPLPATYLNQKRWEDEELPDGSLNPVNAKIGPELERYHELKAEIEKLMKFRHPHPTGGYIMAEGSPVTLGEFNEKGNELARLQRMLKK